VVTQYGADTFRLYEMFIGPFENTTAWNTNAIVGTARFVERVWRLHEKVADEPVPALDAVVEQTVKKVNEDIEAFKFNTAVSQMMICLNAFEKEGRVCRTQWEKFLQMLAPFAPHVADELWEALGHTESIHISTWPTADASKLVAARATIAVQINGKVRGSIELTINAPEEEALAAARANPQVAAWLAKGQEVKAIYVPGRIINFVLR
jgi:leucyl-tRNA synthetase